MMSLISNKFQCVVPIAKAVQCHVRTLRPKDRQTLDMKGMKSRDGGERTVGKPNTGSQQPKMISLVDIWMLGMPWMAAVHFWLCLCRDE